jgi:antitoxin ParD1/3/4
MARSLRIHLNDELRAFVERNSGDGTPHPTANDFVMSVPHRCQAAQEATEIRDAIVEGYQDAIAGRAVEFEGDLRALLRKA